VADEQLLNEKKEGAAASSEPVRLLSLSVRRSENADLLVLGTKRDPVRLTPKRHLRKVDFVFDGNEIRGLEQNPATESRWEQMARSGGKVMQFLCEDRYVANVVGGR
jgi:hypothetical protein